MDFLGRSIKEQMKEDNRKNARFAVIIGDDELESGMYTLRNMAASEETRLEPDKIMDFIGSHSD